MALARMIAYISTNKEETAVTSKQPDANAEAP